MMLAPDKKKMVSVLVAKFGKKPEDSSAMPESGGEADESYGLHASAQSLISAIKSDDAKGVASALKNFYSMCDDDADEGGDNGMPQTESGVGDESAANEGG